MPRRIARPIWITGGLVTTALAMAATVHFSAQHQPAFYRDSLRVDWASQQLAGDQFEARLLQLRNDIQHTSRWQAVFTEEQINGWLAADLPGKFPQAIPPGVDAPRVDLEDGQLRIAFRLRWSAWSGIITARGDVFCTERENEIALRIDGVRSGVVPIPFSRLAEQLTQASSASGVKLTWTEESGYPVAIIQLPEGPSDERDRVMLVDSIQLKDGYVQIAGRTKSSANVGQSSPPGSPSKTTDQR